MSGPSSSQQEVRSTFRACCDCFNAQPETGGATPPALGPRNRSWWYAQAGASGLWYYNYFMQQTLDSYFAGTDPDWCKSTDFSCRHNDSMYPWACYWSTSYTYVFSRWVGGPGYNTRTIIQANEGKVLMIYLDMFGSNTSGSEKRNCTFHEVISPVKPNPFCIWSINPTLGPTLYTCPYGQEKIWCPIPIPSSGRIITKVDDETDPTPFNYYWQWYFAGPEFGDATKRPYILY